MSRTIAALLLLALALPALAQESAEWVKCPCWDCGHPPFMKPVSQCGCKYAGEIRKDLIELEKQGKSRTEIEDHFIARFGEQCLAHPRPEGFGLAAVLLGPIVLGAGGLVVLLVAWRWKRRATSSAPPPQSEGQAADEETVRQALEQEAEIG